MNRVTHTLEPIYDKNSDTLILGSMPSTTSRKIGKYYGHKQNRFWKIMEAIYETDTTDYKKFILTHHLALWDVIASCDISSSSDSSIKNVVVNDIPSLIKKTKITRIFLLGKTSYNLYNKYLKDHTKIEGVYLSSPSSANATKSIDDLIEEYKIIKTKDTK